MDKISFENFIPIYKELNESENIQIDISLKKEFNELKLEKTEELKSGEDFYLHQKFLMRYLTAYDKILNINEAGTGKTGSFIALAKFMKEEIGIKENIYILEKGPSTKEDFGIQLETFLNNKNTKELGYNILTYGEFGNIIKNNYMNDEGEYNEKTIKRDFDGCIFFVDEAHNLISDNDDKKKKTKDFYYNILWKIFHTIKGSKIVLGTATPMINNVNKISNLMNLILEENNQMNQKWDYTMVTTKQMLKYFNGKVTFVRMMETGVSINYMGEDLYDEDYSYKIDYPKDDWDYENSKIDKNGQPKPEEKDLNIKYIKPNTKVYRSEMNIGSLQRKSYKNFLKLNKNKNDAFDSVSKEYSLFVYPNGTRNGKSIEKNDDDIDDENRIENIYIKENDNSFIASKSLKKELTLSGDKLLNLSCKYSQIIEIEKENIGNGCSFIYNESVRGPGVIVMSLCFEENGFEKFSEKTNPFSNETEIIFGKKYKKIKSSFEKKPRYVLITIDTYKNKNVEKILNLINCPQNINGEYLQVLISSKIMRDGINLKNMTRCHITTPLWHYAGYYQAISRLLRQNSHTHIIDKYLQEGVSLSDIKINVDIYNHVTVYNKYTNKLGIELEDEEIYEIITTKGQEGFDEMVENEEIFIEEISNDIKTYVLADDKDIKIKKFMRILKELSVDCNLNSVRNYHTNDNDYSRECDFQECKIKCYSSIDLSQNNKIDFSTYDILYSDKIIEIIIDTILGILSEKFFISINSLESMYNDSILYFYLAISKIFTSKNELYDRFGFKKYVCFDGYYFYLNNINTIYENMSIYNDILCCIDHKTFNEINFELNEKINDSPILEKIENLPYILIDDNNVIIDNKENIKILEELKLLLSQLSKPFLISFLEKEILKFIINSNKSIKYKLKNNDPKISLSVVIFILYDEYIIYLDEPTTNIIKFKEFIESKQNKQGRKGTEKSKITSKDFVFEKFDFENEDYKNPVYINLLDKLNTFSNHQEKAIFQNFDFKIKIAKINDIKWTELNIYEYPIYKQLLKEHRNINSNLNEHKIMGQKYNNVFQIVDTSMKLNKGRNCETMHIIDIVKIFYDEMNTIKYFTSFDSFVSNISESDIKEYLISKKNFIDIFNIDLLEIDSLKFLYFIYYNYKRSELCDILLNYFQSNNRIRNK